MLKRSLAFALLLVLPSFLIAADWPQWRGPLRNDISVEKGLLKSWPADGPKLLWMAEKCGNAYSGMAVVGDVVYSMGADDAKNGNREYVFALNVKDGQEIWRKEIDAKFYSNNWGGGPRCTPTVDGEFLYVIGGGGTIACLKAKDGGVVWSKSATKDLGGNVPGWGYCESPLIDGDKLICTPGGKNGTLAALDKKSGEVIWRSKAATDGAGYGSAIIANCVGIKQYIQFASKGMIGVKADDGKVLWTSKTAANGTANIPTPIVKGDDVFVTSGYGAGCGLVHLASDDKGGITPTTVYDNRDMSNHHGGVILVGDHIFGHSDSKGWVCMEFATGKVVWADRTFGKGSIICADGAFYCFSERDGSVVKIEISTAAWKETSRFKLPKSSKIRSGSGAIWTHPTIANGRLYLRDQDLLFCFDLRGNES